MERCKHGLAAGTCARCADPTAYRTDVNRQLRSRGITEVHRGFAIYSTPPPERVWSFRPAPEAPLQSYRSAFQARRAVNELLDGLSEVRPRRDSAATSTPSRSETQRASGANRAAEAHTSSAQAHPNKADDELCRLLGAESMRWIEVVLPASRRSVLVRAYKRREVRFVGELPANFRTVPNKVAIDLGGVAVYPEFAIIRRLEAAGWGAAWRKNWQGAAFWSDIGAVRAVPSSVLSKFDAVCRLAGAGAWDILAWRGDELLFIESKQYGRDKLTANQLRWLEAAIDQGIPEQSFAVYEYVA